MILPKAVSGFVVLLGLCALSTVEAAGQAAAQAAGELPRSAPEAQGVASADILAFVDAADRQIDTMNSFMLLRHGAVLAEGWWAPYASEHPHILYSLTKSFTSTAVGIAAAEGRLSIHDRVLEYFPESAPEDPSENLQQMRISDLLRMATGHDSEPDLRASDATWVETFLAHPVTHRPGTHFLYNTPATHMLSEIVQKATGVMTRDYLQERLFEPLGIAPPLWLTSPQGTTSGGFGLSLRTEDVAKFGQLYLQQGSWNGRQLVPVDWVRAATRLQVSNGSDPASDWNQGYGYQFWRSRHDSYRGDGAFGQYVIVIPEQDVVVAITSGVTDMQAVMNLVFDKLLPALRAAPLAADPAAEQRLRERLAGLRVAPVAGQASSPMAGQVSGDRYRFTDNELGIEEIRFDFSDSGNALTVLGDGGRTTLAAPAADWHAADTGFAFGLERTPGLDSGPHAAAASGAWTGAEEFTVKLCLYETPFYTTATFRFDADELHLSVEPNVGFGPKEVVTLVGER